MTLEDKQSQKDKIEKLIDWALTERGEASNKDFPYWSGRIEGMLDISAMFGIVIPRARIFLTKAGYDISVSTKIGENDG